jgi:hypothetical protein
VDGPPRLGHHGAITIKSFALNYMNGWWWPRLGLISHARSAWTWPLPGLRGRKLPLVIPMVSKLGDTVWFVASSCVRTAADSVPTGIRGLSTYPARTHIRTVHVLRRVGDDVRRSTANMDPLLTTPHLTPPNCSILGKSTASWQLRTVPSRRALLLQSNPILKSFWACTKWRARKYLPFYYTVVHE